MFAITLIAAVSALEILTYPFSDPDPIPATSETRYPYFRYDGSTERAEMRTWRTVTLENDRIRVVMLPEVGGKVWSATDKVTGRDFLYCNHGSGVVPGTSGTVRLVGLVACCDG